MEMVLKHENGRRKTCKTSFALIMDRVLKLWHPPLIISFAFGVPQKSSRSIKSRRKVQHWNENWTLFPLVAWSTKKLHSPFAQKIISNLITSERKWMLDGFIVFWNNLAGFKNHQRSELNEFVREGIGSKVYSLFISCSRIIFSLIRFIQKNLSRVLIKKISFLLGGFFKFFLMLLCDGSGWFLWFKICKNRHEKRNFSLRSSFDSNFDGH